MQETILKLITLQDLDNKIKTWQQTTAEAPEKLSGARERLTALELERAELEAKIAENGKIRRELEAEHEDLLLRQVTNQSRQLKARNNNEYRAVMKEAETITTNLSAKEDELLAALTEAEKLQAQLPTLLSDCEAEDKAFKEKEAAIKAVVEEGQLHETEFLKEREKLVDSIPPEYLGRYNTISKNRDGQAMAPVVQGMCRICRLSIPPQLYNELQKNDKILSCPNCARILYWMHHPFFAGFCTEPNPQVPAPVADKTEKKAKSENGKRRRTTKAKEPKEVPASLENDDHNEDQDDDSLPVEENIALV
ncbi:MAG: C4-type zinc ribbon domain-containing protein [Deltaproteobacteria bacterium]|nr:C4-type zinc ribbon domain-containing protein [Deltaproteobacteria bacterium]